MLLLTVLALSFGLAGNNPPQTRPMLEEAVALVDSPTCGGAVMAHFGQIPTGPTHLIFTPTLNTSRCRTSSVIASTTRGGSQVWLCMPNFTIAVVQDRNVALVVLVHELLHTQGLGEAPVHKGAPTSLEISRAVRDTCGLQDSTTWKAFGR